jgi:3-oxoacyl-[acyl-carrier protein] reductase
MGKLKDKVAVVTGASKGIGAAIAKEFAAQGATVVVNYSKSKDSADKVVSSITARGGKATAIGADVSRAAEIERLFAEIKQVHGKVDILVNNAGVYDFQPLEKITEDVIDRLFNLNVKGLILATQAAVALFPKEGGNVINISSIASEFTPPTSTIYAGSKGAVNVITRVLANELGPKNIRVNAIVPGPVVTEGFAEGGFEDSDFEKYMVQRTPLGRTGKPEEIASVAAFLASGEAGWLTGQLVQAAGGMR